VGSDGGSTQHLRGQ
jgi:hypothetical protein